MVGGPTSRYSTMFSHIFSSQTRGWRPTTATWDEPKRSSAPITTATRPRTMGCRVPQGLVMRPSTAISRTGESSRRPTTTTSGCTGWYSMHVRWSSSSPSWMESPCLRSSTAISSRYYLITLYLHALCNSSNLISIYVTLLLSLLHTHSYNM